jgi:formylglycine-generating enzyme required for sulfatase activity
VAFRSCNTTGGSVVPTGSTVGCVSHFGAFDLVGNMAEWVADWVPRSTACGTWGSLSANSQCLAGAATTGWPGALIRGGSSISAFGTVGVFSVNGLNNPGHDLLDVGFRAAR